MPLKEIGRCTISKKKSKIVEIEEIDIVRKWADDHACDFFTVNHVGRSNYRVNLFLSSGELIRVDKLSRSFYVTVIDGVVKDCTL